MIEWLVVGSLAALLDRKGIKNQREEERDKRLAREEHARKIAENERKEKGEREKEERNRMIKIRFEKAVERGEDVCWSCKTIKPERCVNCGECISCYENRAYRSGNECCSCWRKRIERECKKAENKGHDVCYSCGTIDPERCYCGNCTVCYGGTSSGCNVCD